MSLRGCPLRGTWDEATDSVRVLRRPCQDRPQRALSQETT
jgi:hypothetical protein